MLPLITPEALHAELPLSQTCADHVKKTRQSLIDILNQQDDRLMVIVGPCSIHDPQSALQYAEKLQTQIKKHEKTLCIVMRAYSEKARTSIGWKGFINDPYLNNTFEINTGLQAARSLLLAINQLGVPIGSEILNPYLADFFSDLISWAAIGARTTESQLHREFASSLSMPVGFKNNTHGDIQVAIDAIHTARQPHYFLHPDLSGNMAIKQSTGNPYGHVVLRGSKQQPNYDTNTIQHTIHLLNQLKLINRVMIDCSHGNSEQDYLQQMNVIQTLAKRIAEGDHSLLGVMIESHLTAGKQAWTPHQTMSGDQSITDACIGWQHTEIALDMLSEAVLARRENMVDCI